MEEIGRRLRAAREAQGITLQAAEEETKIRRKYLQALEDGKSDETPGDAYLKGYIRTYGNFLGLDGPALVEEYKRLTEPIVERPKNARVEAAREARAQRATEENRQAVSIERSGGRTVSPQRPVRPLSMQHGNRSGLGFGLLVLAALAVGWWAAVKYGSPPETPPPQNAPQNSSQQPPTNVPPSQTPTPVPEQPKVTMAPPTGQDVVFAVPAKQAEVRLELSRDRLWFEARDGGKVIRDGTINDDGQPVIDTLDFKGSDLRIRVGHVRGMKVVVNGQRFDQWPGEGPFNFIFKVQ